MKWTEQNWKPMYAALKAHDSEAFRKAQQAAEGVAIEHRLDHKTAAALEVSMIALACELLGVKWTVPYCGARVTDMRYSTCTLPASHAGAHRCSAADVDARRSA